MKLHALVCDLETARRAAAGGATVMQLRLKGVSTVDVIARGRPFRELAILQGLTFIVNDDVEAAIALEAEGVHLGQRDAGAERAIASGLLLGLSAADPEQAQAAERLGAAYVGAGPVWATPSKEDADSPIGLEGLAAVCATVGLPVVAIGGVDATNAAACIRAGAAGVAVIRAVSEAAALRAAVDAAF